MALPPSLELAASKICSTTAIKASVAKGTAHATKQSGKPSKAMEALNSGHMVGCMAGDSPHPASKLLRSKERWPDACSSTS